MQLSCLLNTSNNSLSCWTYVKDMLWIVTGNHHRVGSSLNMFFCSQLFTKQSLNLYVYLGLSKLLCLILNSTDF